MIKVTIKGHGTFRIKEGTLLIDMLRRRNIPVPALCNGRGRCGSCRIKIEGNVQPHDAIEKMFINERLARQGYHLACRFRPAATAVVTVPISSRKAAGMRTRGALALDLGTTVIKAAVVDMKTGRPIRSARAFNLQNNVGGDVVTRIGRAVHGDYDLLHKLLMQSVDALKRQLGVRKPAFISVTGNTVMLSFYLKRPVDGLAHYPFQSTLDKGIFLNDPPSYIFPVIGSFVGGDVISGILASNTFGRGRNVLYADLGTNGEVVLMTPRRVLATSTAAGPAFEGVGISCGSLAVPGAIKKAGIRRGQFTYATINGMKPLGICASGLIELLFNGLKHGYISDSGMLNEPIEIGGLTLTQSDIRKLQLAIGALHTGMSILLREGGLTSGMIDQIVLTGEFGGVLRPDVLKRIGLIPSSRAAVASRKDLALKGAISAIMNDRMRERIDIIKARSDHLDLASHPDFQAEFVRAMRFSPWD